MVPNHQPEYSRNVEDWWKMNKHVSPHSLLPWCLVPSNMSSNNFCRTATSIRPCHWKFQDPKMEVLYHIRPYFLGYIPWNLALKNRPNIYGIGTSVLNRILKISHPPPGFSRHRTAKVFPNIEGGPLSAWICPKMSSVPKIGSLLRTWSTMVDKLAVVLNITKI